MPAPLESLPQSGTTRRIISDRDEIASACVRHGRSGLSRRRRFRRRERRRSTPSSSGGGSCGRRRVDAFGRIGDSTGETWLGFPASRSTTTTRALIGYSLFPPVGSLRHGYSIRSGCGGDRALSEIHVLKDGEAPLRPPPTGAAATAGAICRKRSPIRMACRLWTLRNTRPRR